MKNKGFTLIELLAVIVVLAIVALITVPTVLGVIEKVRKESYKDSVYGIIESGKIYLASHIDSISEKEEIEFTCDGSKCSGNKGELSFKGSVPKSGSIYVRGTGEVLVESLYNGKYYANGSSEEGIEVLTEDSSMTRGELTEEIKLLKEELNTLKNKTIQQDNEINNLKSENNTIKESATSIDEVYPVGSIYITLSDVNPSTIFPGTTWERYGQGKTLVGDDETNYITDDATKGSGGSSTVKLTSNNIPTLSVTGATKATSFTSDNNNSNPMYDFVGNRSETELAGEHNDNNTKPNSNTGSTSLSLQQTPAGLARTFYNNDEKVWTLGGSWSDHGSGYRITMNDQTGYGSYGQGHSHTIGSYDSTTKINNHKHYYTPSGTINIKANQYHTHNISIPILTVNASYTNNNQTSISVQNPYTVVYMWKRVS